MAGAAPTPTRRANLLPACAQNHRPSKVRAYKKGLARRLTGESPASRATSKVWPTNKPSAVRATVRVAAVTRGAGAGASVHPSQIEPTPGLAAAIKRSTCPAEEPLVAKPAYRGNDAGFTRAGFAKVPDR